MTSLKKSLKRKRLNASLKEEINGNEKRKERKPNNTSQVNNRTNIMKACQKVSYEEYRDFKKRFQLFYLPECIDNKCSHGDKKANLKQISQQAEQSFKTEFDNKAWYDAMEICVVCTTSCHYLSPNVLKNVIEIMMNSHEDLRTGYATDYILRKCQHTLMMHFNIHPPCNNNIRISYKEFLTTPLEPKRLSKKSKVTKDLGDCSEGIVSLCINRLIYEISMESIDGTLIEKEEIPTEFEGVKRQHWEKQNLEHYEFLVRTERIKRCMLVLESVIYLLQTDIALWDARCSSSRYSARSQRPLIAYLLWPDKSDNTRCTVTTPCVNIMKLFAYYIHLQYPERDIKTMGLWLNAVVQMFYVSNIQSDSDYPTSRKNVADFVKEFYKIIASLPNSSIIRILDKIQPTFMQYLIGLHHTQHILQTKDDILNVIIWCFNSMSWEDYCIGDLGPKHCKKTTLNPGKMVSSGKCQSLNDPIHVAKDAYQKFELKNNATEVCQNHIIDTLFITFVAYMEAYSIKKFIKSLYWCTENINKCDLTSYYSVSDQFVNKYTSIIKSYQLLLETVSSVLLVNEKHCDEPVPKLSD